MQLRKIPTRMKPIIEVQNLSKLYRLGVIGPTSLRETVGRWLGRHPAAKPEAPTGTEHRAGPDPGTFWALLQLENFDFEKHF